MDDLLLNPDYLSAQDPQTWLRGQLVVSQEKTVEIAFATVGQRENPLWAPVRKLRFTASNFGQIIGAAKRNRLTVSLKKRLLSAYNLEKRAPIQWGVTHEKVAIDDYCKTEGVTVVETGILLHECGLLGASPDGLVQGSLISSKNVHIQQKDQPILSPDLIEVKCPFTARNMTVAEACLANKDFCIDMSSEGRMSPKPTHDYWHQIQGQLHITGTQCCDLAVWTTTDLQIIRIVKDNLWTTNITTMIDFYFSKFLPSL